MAFQTKSFFQQSGKRGGTPPAACQGGWNIMDQANKSKNGIVLLKVAEFSWIHGVKRRALLLREGRGEIIWGFSEVKLGKLSYLSTYSTKK
jgi:hypothetical protein